MSSLKPKEGGSYTAPPYPPTAKPSIWIPVVLAVVIVAIAAYSIRILREYEREEHGRRHAISDDGAVRPAGLRHPPI